MKKHHKLKVTSAMLLTAGLVANILNITHGDVQAPGQSNLSVAKIANTVTSEKDIIKKHNYLPDILGRIGYAVLKAEQTQIDHIRNYQLPDVGVTYNDGTTGFIRNIVNTIKNESEMSSIELDENKDAPIIDWSVIVERSNSEYEPGDIHENSMIVAKLTNKPGSDVPIVDRSVITENVNDKPKDKVITENVNDKPKDEIITENVNDKPKDEVITEKVIDKPKNEIITENINDKPKDEVITEKVIDKHEDEIITENVNDEPKDEVITANVNDEPKDEDPIFDEPLPWFDDFPEMDDSMFDGEMFDDWVGPDFDGVDYLPLGDPDELLPTPDPSVPPVVEPTPEPPISPKSEVMTPTPEPPISPKLEVVTPIVTPTPEPPISPKSEVVTPTPEPVLPTEPNKDVDTEVKIRQETVKIKQGQKLVYDNTLEKGEKRFVEGTPGQIIKTYKDTYHKGILSYSIPVTEETTVEPSPDILYIGSKVSTKASNIVDFKLGDKIKDFKVIEMKGDIEAFVGKDYHELMTESEDARFQKAISTIDASYLAKDPHESEPFDQTYMWLGVGDEMVTVFNSTNFVNKTKVNEYLVNYINMDREAKGLTKLKYDPILQPLTELRAQEMADYGHIRYQGKPHTRPDGTPWLTVLDQLPTDYKSPGFGENMLAYSVLSNPYQLVSEQWIAKRLFEQWKSSPSHYQAMMDPHYTRTAVSFKLTTRTGAKSENNTNWMIGAELFS